MMGTAVDCHPSMTHHGLDFLIKAAEMVGGNDVESTSRSTGTMSTSTSPSEDVSSAPMSQTLTAQRSQPHAMIKPRSRPPKNRENHNRKEKMRRDSMRDQLQELRKVLAKEDPDHDFAKLSCLQLLQRGAKKIRDEEAHDRTITKNHEQLRSHGIWLRKRIGMNESTIVIPPSTTSSLPLPMRTHAGSSSSSSGGSRISHLGPGVVIGGAEVDAADDDVTVNVTDDTEAEVGSNVSDSSRLRAALSATTRTRSPAATISAPLPPITAVGMCVPQRANLPSLYSPFPLMSVQQDINNPTSAGAFLYQSCAPVYGIPTAQTASFTSVNVHPQSRQLFASMANAQSS